MIILMTTSRRPPQRYDHRLRELVRATGNVTIVTDLGVPRSTARGWLRKAPAVVVSLDVTNLSTSELQQEIVALLRFLRLSPSRFHAWRRLEHTCALDDQSSCPHLSPHRLTSCEVLAIKDM